jgi:hypothetical protein
MVKGISLVMYGINKCSGGCLYCSAASTMSYRDKKNKNTFKFDKEKTKQKILEYTNVIEDSKREPVELNVDIWGGNPVENFDEFKQVVEFLQNDLKEFITIRIHTSGNGLELRSNDIVKYLIDNNIHYQLSHDGLGQYLRTGVIDPLYWEETAENIANLTRLGIIDWINCTLSNRNFSLFENKKYFDDWRIKNNLMGANELIIKLNHIYPGTPPIDKKWIGPDIPALYGRSACKNGESIGEISITGENLVNYMHEFRKMGLICMTSNIDKFPEWRPYINYISSQLDRWKIINSDEEAPSMCRKFQMGLIDKNFAIDTTGEYCQCNLIDSSSTVKNPSGKRTSKCDTCVYKNQADCYQCGSEKYEEDCQYLYQWCQVLEEFAQLKILLNNYSTQNQCNCGEHNHKKENGRDPVFCVKNYNF